MGAPVATHLEAPIMHTYMVASSQQGAVSTCCQSPSARGMQLVACSSVSSWVESGQCI